MSERFRRTMAELHSWGGLVAGWLLFAVFLTGTLSYFRPEISLWMRPELPAAGNADPTASAVRMADWLQDNAPDAARWLILPADARHPAGTAAVWSDQGEGPRFRRVLLDATTGRPVDARETMGGDFLYYFHFDLNLPGVWGRLLVGAAAVVMLAAIVSGVIIHRRIFTDFFTFRPDGSAPRAWLDAHNAAGVLALPYHLMITFSGLVTLMYLYMPWGVDIVYGGDRAAYFAEAEEGRPVPPASGTAAPLAAMDGVLAEASRRWGGAPPGRIEVHRPNDANAAIEAAPHEATSMSYLRDRIAFDGASGTVIGTAAPSRPAADTRAVLYGLHLARFAGPGLRWLFALSGAVGTAMIATGLVLWVAKRRRKEAGRPSRGLRVAERMNVATIGGLPIAVAGLFWANRLVPVPFPSRLETEGLIFYVVWASAALHAALVPPDRAWRQQFGTAAALFTLVPVLNATTTGRGLMVSLPAGDWPLAGFDLCAVAAGSAFAWLACRRGGVSGAGAAR
ncbi:PepSY-associated TM helix domain-containing protein [Azospirillum sp. ST 5-10]|uniref:PepSY-associated TM helix domain-containing protein n=1 Tax=unclassified Azospirillum TaxID=2630922 RepID=UPI003F4A373B